MESALSPKTNAGPLEEVIEIYELLINNDTDFPTRPGSRGVSIIGLALTSPDLGLLRVWEIPEEYPSLSDHELIMTEWEDIGMKNPEDPQLAMSGWSIQNLLQDKNLRQAAKDEWKKSSIGQNGLTAQSTKEELDKEVEWFGAKIITLLISNPTRALVCAAKYLHFLCSLGNLSAASLLARDGGACAARPGLVAEKGEPPRTPSIYATDTWSGRVGEAKYKRRDANDNKRDVKCEMRNAKCEMGVAIAAANVDVMPSCICLPPSLYLLSPPPQPPSPLLSSALSETRPAMSEWQLCSAISESCTAMSEWRLSLASASFPSLADYPSVKLTSLDNYAKITRVCAYSKGWWNEEVAEARKRWERDKIEFGRDEDRKQELKQARNSYYRTIRKAKRLCWQNFLGKLPATEPSSGSKTVLDRPQIY